MKVAIIGHGFVGTAMHALLSRKHEVVWYDPGIEGSTWGDVQGAALAVVCVPTPSGPGGACDVSAVEEACARVDAPLVLVKSTVPPGTCDRLAFTHHKNVCFSPEYIGSEPTWPALNGDPDSHDIARHGWVTIGGERFSTSLIVDILMPCMGPGTVYHQCSNTEAELAKYMENAWLATKVTFCNEFAAIARLWAVDYNRLRELWLADPRVGRSHTAVFPEAPGWGGRCLPKDLAAIIRATCERGGAPLLLEAVQAVNATHTAGRPHDRLLGEAQRLRHLTIQGISPDALYSGQQINAMVDSINEAVSNGATIIKRGPKGDGEGAPA